MYFLFIDNVKDSWYSEIKPISSKDNYKVFNSSGFIKPIPNKYFRKLLKQGLFMTDKNRTAYQPMMALHRLVACIVYKIKGLTIHHIDKDKNNNAIVNLVPLSQEKNSKLDLLPFDKMVELGKQAKREWDDTKERRYFVTENEDLHKEIVLYSLKHSTQEVIKHFKRYIKTPQKIRDILNFYFYKKEFIEWCKTNAPQEFTE